jgi:hypothetical protein
MIKAVMKANPDILLKFGPNGKKFMSTLIKKQGTYSIHSDLQTSAFDDIYSDVRRAVLRLKRALG